MGPWPLGRGVLVPPTAVGHPDLHERVLPIARTRAQVAHGPPIDADRPVSRQREAEVFRAYGWPQFWVSAGLWGAWAYPAPLFTAPPPLPAQAATGATDAAREAGDPHLRSTREVTGYRIRALDGELGHVDDFVLDDTDWSLRYLVVDTGALWSDERVLVEPARVREILWDEKCVCVEATRAQIANAQPWDPHAPVNREFEEHVYDYYGREVPHHHGR